MKFSIAQGASACADQGAWLIIGMQGDNISAIHRQTALCGAPVVKRAHVARPLIFTTGKFTYLLRQAFINALRLSPF